MVSDFPLGHPVGIRDLGLVAGYFKGGESRKSAIFCFHRPPGAFLVWRLRTVATRAGQGPKNPCT